MASDTLTPFSEGKVAQDARADDEEEMRRLRAAAGGATRVRQPAQQTSSLELSACLQPTSHTRRFDG